MSVNKFNAEGYHDPTVFEALTNIEKEEKQRKYRQSDGFILLMNVGNATGGKGETLGSDTLKDK